ncbi:FAD-binding oxidoreductase [Akkermansiaceae bacterium]|nr:FAD-binding oxidoreductase [Akkermansiaceae bacterium]
MGTNFQGQTIIGQGLAGSCLAWEFLWRGVPFRIADRGAGGSTRVAAGMVNPVTGKNFEPSWRISEFHPAAIAFYRRVEEELGITLWHPMPILRLAGSEKERGKISSKLGLAEVAAWVDGETAEVPAGFLAAYAVRGGGWLDAAGLISLSRRYFESLGLYDEGDCVSSPGQILCTGAAGLTEGQLGPHRCAKGEILTVSAAWPESHIRIGAGGWLVPIGSGLFRVGSTYEWDQLDESPTPAGLNRISEIAAKLGGAEFGVRDHVAGVRPILRRSQPLIGRDGGGNWTFNGLGSKGTLYAPGIAAMLADWMLDGKTPHPDFILPEAP